MAVIDWKGARWEAAFSSFSIPEVLTILKGYGPMEILRFEVPGCSKGELSLCLTDDGSKEITLYSLEVLGPPRQGKGRECLRWLKRIFKGPIFVESPEQPPEGFSFHPSLPFWLRMYRDGVIDALDCESFYLDTRAGIAELERVEQLVRAVLQSERAASHP